MLSSIVSAIHLPRAGSSPRDEPGCPPRVAETHPYQRTRSALVATHDDRVGTSSLDGSVGRGGERPIFGEIFEPQMMGCSHRG
jgi:hypothetical protein